MLNTEFPAGHPVASGAAVSNRSGARRSGLCRRCGIFGDLVRLRWWHKLVPGCRRWYCAGCGKTFLSLF